MEESRIEDPAPSLHPLMPRAHAHKPEPEVPPLPAQPGVSEPVVESLTTRTASSFAWMTGVSIATKPLAMGGNVILAWLLLDEHFGVYGLALAWSSFPALLQSAGVREVLVQRQKHLDTWINPGFWLALTMGLFAAAITVGLGPLAARVHGEPALAGVMAVMALTRLTDAGCIVPMAIMQSQMRFRPVAMLAMVNSLGVTVISIALAKFGMKAYSLAVPQFFMGVVQVIAYWRLARPRIHRQVQFKHWKSLFSDSGPLLGGALLINLITQGDRMSLGWYATTAVVGGYVFALNMTTRTIVVFTENLTSTLLPALSKLGDDPSRQAAAFMRAARALAVVAAPVCLLQAALSGPMVRLIFAPRWHDTVPLFQILALAMNFVLLASPASSLMKAQGRFKFQFLWSCIITAVYLPMTIAGAALDQARGVAIVVALFNVIVGPIGTYAAVYPARIPFSAVLNLYVRPILACAIGIAIGIGAAELMLRGQPPGKVRDILWSVAVLGCTAATYPSLVRSLVPDAYAEITGRLRHLLARVWKRRAAAA